MTYIPRFVTVNSKTKIIGEAFNKGSGGKFIAAGKVKKGDFIATYGILHGTETPIKTSQNYLYIDHGYFGRSKHGMSFDGYFRVVRNSLVHKIYQDHDFPYDRFKSFNLKIRPWRKTGKHIILVPPSRHVAKFFNFDKHKWIEKIKKKIAQHTDRPVIVSVKNTNPSFFDLVDNAWCCVTFHSNIILDSLINGIPVVSLSDMRRIGSLDQIENPPMERDFIKNFAYYQWTLDQMRSGQAWREIVDLYNLQ